MSEAIQKKDAHRLLPVGVVSSLCLIDQTAVGFGDFFAAATHMQSAKMKLTARSEATVQKR